MQKAPKSRKFPPRLSDEELKKRVTEEVDTKGGKNFFQARYHYETEKEVMASKKPIFANIKPEFKENYSESYIKAFSFVIEFLEKYQMENTENAIQEELPEGSPFAEASPNFDYDIDDLVMKSKKQKTRSLEDKGKELMSKIA